MSVPSQPRSALMTRIGGVDYPMRNEPKCRTCQSPYRTELENAIMEGRTYAAIARWVAEQDPGPMRHPDSFSLRHHMKSNHMPLPAIAQRKLIERRAEELGKNMEDASETLVDYVTVNRLVVQKGFERMARGEMEPSMTDLLSAIRSLHGIETSIDGGVDQEAWVTVVSALVETVRERVDPRTWAEIGYEMSRNPALRALMAKPIEDAVVVEETVHVE